MRGSKARSTCREDRVILFKDLPKTQVIGPRGGVTVRAATDQELMQLDIHVYYRGTQRVKATCNGYLDTERQCGVNAAGEPWPGELIAGKRGLYRKKRQPLIEASLKAYKDGNNGGYQRLMLDKRPEEFDRKDDKGKTVPGVVLSESDRLERALPRIMGDWVRAHI